MIKRLSAFALLFSVACAAQGLAAPVPPPTSAIEALPGKLESVTVYRGQALVSRLIDLKAKAGLHEVVINNLPPQIIASSLFAESAEGLEVRSVLYRERPVDTDIRADVRKLDEQIRTIQDQATAIQRTQQTLAAQTNYLNRLENFVAPTANAELTKGVLNADTLKTLTNYIFDQRKAIADQELKLNLDLRTHQEQAATLQRQREQITQQSARTMREAVVFINLKQDNGQFHLRYMVDQANWEPSYNIRADGKGAVTVEYNASIQQQSGEDWTDVAMTLSTATPSLVAKAPQLDPLLIGLTALSSSQPGKMSVDYKELRKGLAQQKQDLEYQRNGSAYFDQSNSISNGIVSSNGFNAANNKPAPVIVDADRRLNDIASQEQVAELLFSDSPKDGKSANDNWTVASNEVISVTYELPGHTNLPSRNDRQLIQVASLPVQGEFYKVAVPVLTNYVYNQATLTNKSNRVLLAGPVSSYMAGQFVGHGEIPTVAAGETFVVGFGIDSSLRATRERVDKQETTQGGNRILNYTYRLAVENFGNEPAQIRLMDRLPTTRENLKESDVRVTLETPPETLSTDETYLRTSRKQGILRWDLTAPANAIGPKARILEYKFKVEYDKQNSLTISK